MEQEKQVLKEEENMRKGLEKGVHGGLEHTRIET